MSRISHEKLNRAERARKPGRYASIRPLENDLERSVMGKMLSAIRTKRRYSTPSGLSPQRTSVLWARAFDTIRQTPS